MKNLIPYTYFALKAIRNHNRDGVSIEFLELLYRIDYRCKVDDWSVEHLSYELLTLQKRFPDDYARYMHKETHGEVRS